MNVHFIAIGGAAMHNLALALHAKGYQVTGSDDEIFEPSKSRLKNAGILPENTGWYPEKIDKNLDAVILGMHARNDNPELIKAKELGLRIYSYPEFIFEQTQHKIRAVIGGSHGKTTITSMIMHALKDNQKTFDYLVGSIVEGFDTMVGLDNQSSYAVIEGDEYLASPLHLVPKFHLYRPNIALISGVAWDHINVFPTFEAYVKQFELFIDTIEPNGTLVYCTEDDTLKQIIKNTQRKDLKLIGYSIPPHQIINGTTVLITEYGNYHLKIFGNHNLMNLEGAKIVCSLLGLNEFDFYNSIKNFKGAARRLEIIKESPSSIVYKDFAHSPSKLKATILAVKKQFPERRLIAVMELHTFSSLNKAFLKEYKDCMQDADISVVFYSPETVSHKRLESINQSDIRSGFNQNNLTVFDHPNDLKLWLSNLELSDCNLLLMSSGNWGGIKMEEILQF